jgi:type II secretory pathway component PulJ
MTNLELRIARHHRVKNFSILNSQFSILLCIIGLLFCCSAAAETPGFNFQPGDKYLLTSVTEEKITRTVDSNERIRNRTTRFECDFDVEEVDEDGQAWAKYTYRRTGKKITGPDINLDFDTNTKSRKVDLQTLPMLLVIGEGLYIRISPQGRVAQINGLQAALSNVNSNIPRMSDRDKLTITNIIDEMLSESTIKRTLEEQLAVFPDSNHNSQWSRTIEVPSKKIEQKWSYRIKSSKDDIIIVDVNLESTPSADTDEVTRGDVKYRRQTSGWGQGRIEIDLNAVETHPIIKSVITQDLTDELKISSQGPLLRVPKIAEPVQTHIESTFLMTRREPPAKTGEPNQPLDTNH